MIVIDINSGLGNQMLAYCVVLSMQKANPNQTIYIETIIYEIEECNEVISQWNGYELESIFGIKVPNVKSLFSEDQWGRIIKQVRDSKFWTKNWNYPPVFTEALNNNGLRLINKKGDYNDPKSHTYKKKDSLFDKVRNVFFNKSIVGSYIKYKMRCLFLSNQMYACAHPERLYLKTDSDVFTGMWLDFKYNGNKIEEIHDDILKTFVFPDFTTIQNTRIACLLDSTNSVFIHARRGDMLSANGWCYKYGYFKRAVKYIKKNVKDPLFVFFTNTGSIDWCKEHTEDIFGLRNDDKVIYVDWNTGDQSFRDMQLMTHCKHGIITNSTFGWWGAYLIQNPEKITISPLAEINTTYHC